jgi:hypothetical protein
VARVTVVDSAASPGTGGVATNGLVARVTVVDDVPPVTPVVTAPDSANDSAAAKLQEVALGAAASGESEAIDTALKGLIGNWTAVARHGDGELTTVELQLDDRGWAELTVPAPDGKRSTIKRRVELKDDELRLTGADADLLLGKLVTVNSRQMVLERAGGEVTFVRP